MAFGSEMNKKCNFIVIIITNQNDKLTKSKFISISREPQPTVKQVPFGYFRAFTYQPFAFNPQTPNQYLSYAGGKMLQQPNSLYSYPKTLPGPSGLPQSIYGPVPSHSIPPPPSTQSSPPAAPTQTTQQQTPTQSAPSTPTTGTQPQPSLNDVQPPTTVPAQFSSNPHVGNSPPMRQMPYVPEPVNLQYITNVGPLPVQQVQFVPCMCPVAVSISTGISPAVNPELIANKRSDDIQISADYHDPSIIGEQSLSEER